MFPVEEACLSAEDEVMPLVDAVAADAEDTETGEELTVGLVMTTPD